MLQERLLERLRNIEANPNYRGLVEPNQITASILSHLRKILNTRQGSALIDDDYGMPDFTDLAANFSAEVVRDLSRAIRNVIQKYEPRLVNVNIEAEPKGESALMLHFKIDGNIDMGDNVILPVSFETVVDPDGRIRVDR